MLLWSWYRDETHNLPVIALVAGGIILLWMRRSLLDVRRIHSSIDECRTLEVRLADSAQRDPLVGLLNHAAFQDRLEDILAKQGGAVVLYIDIDDFKNVNDTLGHKAGDDVLIETAHRIRSILHDTDDAARLGSDEFGILLPGVDAEAGEVVASHVLELLRSPIPVNGKLVHINGSIGLAVGGPDDTPDGLVRDAHVALYLAKNAGKNRFQLFRPSAHASILSRIALRAQLSEAITAGQFVLHYQPIVNVADRSLVACEALVRWQHPERGLIGPDEFIPIAEETGLIVELGRWIMREACTEAAKWATLFGARAPAISVNASGIQFRDPAFPSDIDSAVAASGLDPRSLIIELTESTLINADGAADLLAGLRHAGTRIALDDFGTGYSSLAYLARYPIDILKVDRAFVQSIGTGSREDMLTSAIVNLARDMKIQVIAEGVETIEQFERLAELKCDWIQGYLISRPLPSERIRLFITTSLGHELSAREQVSNAA
jgi:diguanylate cyclase (GGDEF)-like protein